MPLVGAIEAGKMQFNSIFNGNRYPSANADTGGAFKAFNGKQMQIQSLQHLTSLHNEFFKNYSTENGLQYMRSRHGYFKAVKEQCACSLPEALAFHEDLVYLQRKANHVNDSAGQDPGLIILTNSPHAQSGYILTFNTKQTVGNRRVGAAFCVGLSVLKESDLLYARDAISVKYALHLMDGRESQLAPVVPVECAIGSKGDNGRSIGLGELRRSNFIQRLEREGHIIIKSGKTPFMITRNKNGEPVVTLFPLLMNDTAHAMYYVREEKALVPFGEWAERVNIGEHPIIQRIVSSMALHHSANSDIYEEFVSLNEEANFKKKCVDSRLGNRIGAEKYLAAILQYEEKKQEMEKGKERVENDLHFGCGGMNIGIQFHTAMTELRTAYSQMLANGFGAEAESLYLGEFKREMDKLFAVERGTPKISIHGFITAMELFSGMKISGQTIGLLESIFAKETNDMQDTVRDMAEKKVVKWRSASKQYIMMSAAWVATQQEKGNEVPIKTSKYTSTAGQVTLFESHRQNLSWERAKKETNSGTEVYVGVEDLGDLTHVRVVKEGKDLIVVDCHTGEPV